MVLPGSGEFSGDWENHSESVSPASRNGVDNVDRVDKVDSGLDPAVHFVHLFHSHYLWRYHAIESGTLTKGTAGIRHTVAAKQRRNRMSERPRLLL